MKVYKVEPQELDSPAITIFVISESMTVNDGISRSLLGLVIPELERAGTVAILFDMSEVTNFDSSAVGEIVTCVCMARETSRFKFGLLNPAPVVVRYLTPTKLVEKDYITIIEAPSDAAAKTTFRNAIKAAEVTQ